MDDVLDIELIPVNELKTFPNLIRKFIFADDTCSAVSKEHDMANIHMMIL